MSKSSKIYKNGMEMKRIYGFWCQATTGRVSNPNHIHTHTYKKCSLFMPKSSKIYKNGMELKRIYGFPMPGYYL